jgi:membrane protein implicated in regulation of membrane protease activity
MPFDFASVQDYWFWLVISLAVAIVLLQTAFVDLLPFLVGTLCATFVAYATAQGTGIQLTVFIAVSLVAFLAFRPLSQRIAKGKPGQFGVDRLVGKLGLVTESIDWKENSGLVRVSQEEWPARSTIQEVLPQGTTVKVERVEGNRLYVTAASESES